MDNELSSDELLAIIKQLKADIRLLQITLIGCPLALLAGYYGSKLFSLFFS